MQKEATPYKLSLSYNPYEKEKRMTCWFFEPSSGEWAEISSDNGKLYKFLKSNPTLQHKIQDVFDALQEFAATNSKGIEIEFSGLETDFHYLQTYFKQHCTGEYKPIDIKQSHSTLIPPVDAMPHIKKQFSELERIFDEMRRENEEVQELLRNFKETVRPTISICVVGTYSSGKSAFINALIGEEVLPSETDPTTAKIYKVMRCKKNKNLASILFDHNKKKFKLEFFENGDYICASRSDDPIIAAWVEAMKSIDQKEERIQARRVYESLKLINSKANEKDGEELKYNIGHLLEIRVPFVRSNLPWDEFEFEIYDTPGSNSESHKEHLDTLKDILQKLTNGLPVIVSCPTTLDSNDTKQLLQDLEANGGNLDLGNAIIAVNQADGFDPEKLKALAAKEGTCIQQWRSRLLFASAIMGLASKKESIESAKDFFQRDYARVFKDKRDTFTTPDDEFYTQLFLCDLLPGDASVQKLHDEGKQKTGESADERTLLLHNSGLWAIEHEIGEYARNFALYNKCYKAREFLEDLVQKTQEKIRENRAEIDQERQALQSELDEEQQKLMEILHTRTEEQRGSDKAGYTVKLGASMAQFNQDFQSDLETFLCEMKALVKGPGSHKHDVTRRTEAFVNEELHKLQKIVSKTARPYWRDASKRFKLLCVEVIKGSDALNQEEQNYLTEFILNQSETPVKQLQNIDLEDVVTERWILSFLFGKEKFHANRCKENIEKVVTTTRAKFLLDESSKRSECYTTWTEDLVGKLQQQLARWNPKLKQWSEEIEAKQKRLSDLEVQLDQLMAAGREIGSILKFRADTKGIEGGCEV